MGAAEDGAMMARIAPRGDGAERLRQLGYLLMVAGAVGVVCGRSGSPGEPVAAAAKMLLPYMMWLVGCGFLLFSMTLNPDLE